MANDSFAQPGMEPGPDRGEPGIPMNLHHDTARPPTDVVAAEMRQARDARDEAERARITAAAQPVLERFRAEQSKLVTPDVQRRLREHAAGLRLPDDAGVEERRRRAATQRAYAAQLGVDLVALDRMRADFGRQCDAILPGASPPAPASRAPQADALQAVNWNGWWDAGFYWYSSHASQFALWDTVSYHNLGTSRAGSHIRFRQRETDDSDIAYLTSHNGFMIWYTPFVTDGIVLEMDLRCHVSRYFIDTDNEPGNSSCHVKVQQWLVAEWYRSWSDASPIEHVDGFLENPRSSTDLEEWVDEQMTPPGSLRTNMRVFSGRKYPPGQPVAIYIGVSNRANAFSLNDTRCTLGVDGGWYIERLTIKRANWL